jgi:Sulfotransferase family
VVLVAATARSGTTLLGTLLDLHPQVAYLGELNRRQTWSVAMGRCGCGAPYAECASWSTVLSMPSFDDDPAPGDRWASTAEIDRLEAAVRRPSMVLRALVGRPTADQRRYVAYLDKLYRDLAADRGATVVVDTSKLNLVDLVLLRLLSTLPTRVVHLYRDPRGVVFSRLSGARERKGRGWNRRAFAVRLEWPVVLADTLRWDRSNVMVLLLRRRLGAVIPLTYEQLVGDSRGTTRHLVADLGLDPDDLADAWVGPDVVEFPENHSMRGNRARRRRGPTPVVADLRWRDGLPGSMAAGVQVLTAPARRLLARTASESVRPESP